MNFAIGVKAYIIDEQNKMLFIKRKKDNPHNPGTWDHPGGRLNPGEDIIQGLKREIKEETNLEVDVIIPLEAHSFTRQDGQHITLVCFLCKKNSNDFRLSEEHSEYKWIDIEKDKDMIPSWDLPVIENYLKFGLSKYV